MKTRAIVLVHGVGEQRQGEVLESVLEPFLRFLRGNFPDVHAQVTQRPDDGPSSATIRFLDEQWEIWEAHWASAFFPQPRFRVLRWAFRALFLNLGNSLVGTLPLLHGRLWIPIARAFYVHPRRTLGGSVVFWALAVLAAPLMFLYGFALTILYAAMLALWGIASLLAFLLAWVPGLGTLLRRWERAAADALEWATEPPGTSWSATRLRPPPDSVASRVYDLIVGLSSSLVFALAYTPLLFLAMVFFVLALLPRWLIFPRWLATLAVDTATYLLEGFGDQYALMYTETAASAVRQRLRVLLSPYLDANLPTRRNCDSLTVIAHSAGATVALGVLSDARQWRDWTGGKAPPMPVTFFTVGSSLTVSHENVPGHPMFRDSLPPWVTWIDLWARYDPIPHGPASEQLRRKVRGTSGRFESVRVVNRDTPFADHSTYWTNHEEVLSRFLQEITGQPDLLSKDANEVSKAVAVRQAHAESAGRRRRIGLLNMFQVVVVGGVAFFGGVSAGLFVRTGSGFLNAFLDWPAAANSLFLAPADLYARFTSYLPSWLLGPLPGTWDSVGRGLTRAAEFSVGLGLFALGVYVLVQALVLWVGAIFYRDPWGDAGGSRLL